MSIHHDKAEGLCESPDQETQSYVFNQTMMRIKAVSYTHLTLPTKNEV